MAVYTRSRWMDMQHTDEIVLDPNELAPIFVELRSKGAVVEHPSAKVP